MSSWSAPPGGAVGGAPFPPQHIPPGLGPAVAMPSDSASVTEQLQRIKAAAACEIINKRVLIALEQQGRSEKMNQKLRRKYYPNWKDPNVTNPNNAAYRGPSAKSRKTARRMLPRRLRRPPSDSAHCAQNDLSATNDAIRMEMQCAKQPMYPLYDSLRRPDPPQKAPPAEPPFFDDVHGGTFSMNGHCTDSAGSAPSNGKMAAANGVAGVSGGGGAAELSFRDRSASPNKKKRTKLVPLVPMDPLAIPSASDSAPSREHKASSPATDATAPPRAEGATATETAASTAAMASPPSSTSGAAAAAAAAASSAKGGVAAASPKRIAPAHANIQSVISPNGGIYHPCHGYSTRDISIFDLFPGIVKYQSKRFCEADRVQFLCSLSAKPFRGVNGRPLGVNESEMWYTALKYLFNDITLGQFDFMTEEMQYVIHQFMATHKKRMDFLESIRRYGFLRVISDVSKKLPREQIRERMEADKRRKEKKVLALIAANEKLRAEHAQKMLAHQMTMNTLKMTRQHGVGAVPMAFGGVPPVHSFAAPVGGAVPGGYPKPLNAMQPPMAPLCPNGGGPRFGAPFIDHTATATPSPEDEPISMVDIISEIDPEINDTPDLPPDTKGAAAAHKSRGKNADLSLFINAMEFVPSASAASPPRDKRTESAAARSPPAAAEKVSAGDAAAAGDEQITPGVTPEDLYGNRRAQNSDKLDVYALLFEADGEGKMEEPQHRKTSEEPDAFRSGSPTTDESYEMKEDDVAMDDIAGAVEDVTFGGGAGGEQLKAMEGDIGPDVSFSDVSDVSDIAHAEGGFIAKLPFKWSNCPHSRSIWVDNPYAKPSKYFRSDRNSKRKRHKLDRSVSRSHDHLY